MKRSKRRPHYKNDRPTIAFIIDRILGLGGYQSDMWRGVVQTSRERDTNLICFNGGSLRESPENEFEFQRNVIYNLISENCVDGLIISSATLSNTVSFDEIRQFCNQFLPLPTVCTGLPMEGIPSLCVENLAGLREAITHLIGHHNRRKIAIIRGPEQSTEAQERFQTYLEVLEEYGIPREDDLIVSGDFTRSAGIEAVRVLFDERKVRCDAIIAANDNMALTAMEAIQQRGILIPDDIAVVGFDDILDSRVSSPPLTTVRQPIYELGRRAVNFLMTILEGGSVPDKETLPTTLVVRQSCGCELAINSESLESIDKLLAETKRTVSQRDFIIDQVVQAYDPLYLEKEEIIRQATKLVDTYLAAMYNMADVNHFYTALESTLRKDMIRGWSVKFWQRAISTLNLLSIPLTNDLQSSRQAALIWQQANRILGRMGHLSVSHNKLQQEYQAEPIRYASQALLTTFDATTLMEKIREHSPDLGIRHCVISLFEDPAQPSGDARLMLAYNHDAQDGTTTETGQIYPGTQLVPNGFLDNEARCELVANTLYFREDLFGFSVIGMENLDFELADNLSTQISAALQGAKTFQELKEADREIRRRAAHVEALNTIITAAATEDDLQRLLETALNYTLQALELDVGSIWVPPYIATRGFPESIADSISRDMLTQDTIEITEPIVIEDWQRVTQDETLASVSSILHRHEIRASIIAPILDENGVTIGGLGVSELKPRHWSGEEINLLNAVGRQLGTSTERVRLLKRIREQMRQVQQIIDTVPDGVILLDNDGLILLTNPAGEKELGYLSDSIIGETLFQLGDCPLTDLLNRDTHDAWSQIKIDNRFIEATAQPLAKGSQAEGWVLVLRDVTQERETQRRVQQQERLAAVGQMAGGIAHDFNNMLTTIMLYAQRPLRKHELNKDLKKSLTTILNESKQAANLIQQILDFSRRSPLETSPVDLGPFIKEAVRVLQRTIPENISLYLEIDPNDYVVESDPTRIQQVLMNLVVNARDAMPNGGTLRIKVSCIQVTASEKALVVGMEPGDWFCLSVSDTGTGIPQELLPHIFEPFFTTKPAGVGTGLGLAQVYGIVKQHNGHIDVDTEVGKGSTFHIYLPLCRVGKDLSLQDEAIFAAPQGKGEVILIVEDNVSMREVGQQILEDLGYQVLTASNGKEALEIYRENGNVDLVFTDIVMPEIGGAALLRELRQMGSKVKAIAVTGHILAEDLDHLRQSGVVSVVHKPYDVDILADVIREALDED